MSGVTSSTGLIASVKNPARRKRLVERKRSLDTRHLVTKAPVALKPFAGLYNPFPYRCSILCNHPADCEARDVVRRAKESWIHDSKSIPLAPSEEYLHNNHHNPNFPDTEFCRAIPTSPEVPEELFRRYTDTDSRPLTPCVTLASAMTRGSMTSGRRCVTPDPVHVKTLLVLDLRRSHSQETLACCLPGMLSSQGGLTCSPTPPDNSPSPKVTSKVKTITQPGGVKAKLVADVSKLCMNQEEKLKDSAAEDEEETIRRRGKKKKKKTKAEEAKDLEKEFRGLTEPGETLVSVEDTPGTAVGDETSPSGRNSICPVESGDFPPGTASGSLGGKSYRAGSEGQGIKDSFLEFTMIKQLQRELDYELVDNEFNKRRRIALREALRILKPKILSADLQRLHNTLSQTKTESDSWLTLPRTFSRKSSRFELPLDSRLLTDMSPLEYLESYVWISPGRRLLYNRVFNRYLVREGKRIILGKDIIPGLGDVMGRPLSEEEAADYRGLLTWRSRLRVRFKLWCGLCALFERIYAKNFCTEFLSKEQDPCNAVEIADFETLHMKLKENKPHSRLGKMLQLIKTQ